MVPQYEGLFKNSQHHVWKSGRGALTYLPTPMLAFEKLLKYGEPLSVDACTETQTGKIEALKLTISTFSIKLFPWRINIFHFTALFQYHDSATKYTIKLHCY